MDCNHEWVYDGMATFGGDTIEHTHVFACMKCMTSRKATYDEKTKLYAKWGTSENTVRERKTLWEFKLFGRIVEVNVYGKPKKR